MKNLKELFDLWQYQYNILLNTWKGLPESELKQNIYQFSRYIANSMPWHEFVPLISNINRLANSVINSFDAPQVSLEKMKPLIEDIHKLIPLSDKMDGQGQEAASTMKKIDNQSPAYQECENLFKTSSDVYKLIDQVIETYTGAERRLRAVINQAEPSPESEVHIPEFTKQDKTNTINSILDQFTRGEITKDQMDTRIKSLGNTNVARTVNSIGNLKLADIPASHDNYDELWKNMMDGKAADKKWEAYKLKKKEESFHNKRPENPLELEWEPIQKLNKDSEEREATFEVRATDEFGTKWSAIARFDYVGGGSYKIALNSLTDFEIMPQ